MNLRQELSLNRGAAILFVASLVLLAIGIGAVTGDPLKALWVTGLGGLLLIALGIGFYLIMLIPTVAHYLGVFLTAKAQGGLLVFGRVGPLVIDARYGRVRYSQYGWNVSDGWFLILPKPDANLVLTAHRMVMVGRFTDLVVGCCFLLLAGALYREASTSGWGFTGVFVLAFFFAALMSLSAAMGDRQAGNYGTDLRTDPFARMRLACLAIYAEWTKGKRARDWNPAWLEAALGESPPDQPNFHGPIYNGYHALDSGDTASAILHFESGLALCDGGAEESEAWRKLFSEELAFCYALSGEVEKAEATVPVSEEASGEEELTSPGFRARAAIAAARGDTEAATDLIQRSRQAVTKDLEEPYPDNVQAELEWLDNIERWAQENAQPPSDPPADEEPPAEEQGGDQ